jgi:hypothetical protein
VNRVPHDYSALVFADQGLSMDMSREFKAPRAKRQRKPAPVLIDEMRRMQTEHVITRMRAANARPATFIWPEAIPA